MTTPTIPRPADQVVCYHEAGHAVASVLLGRKVLFVTVDSGEDYKGTPHHGLTSSPPLKPRRIRGTKEKGILFGKLTTEAKIAIAGPVTEAVCTQVPLEIDLQNGDYAKAYVIMSTYLHTDQGRKLTGTAEPTDDDIADAVYALAHVVGKLLVEHWEAVNRVMGALSTERSISGPRLRQLVNVE